MEAKPALAITVALAIGAGAGYVAGHRAGHRPPEAGGQASASSPRTQAAARGPAAPRGTPPTATDPAAPGSSEAALTGNWAADLASAMALPSSTARADRLRELAGAASLAEVVRILEIAETVLPSDALGLFGERLLERLALSDPLKALAIADRQEGRGAEDHGHAWRSAILEAWIDHDAAAATRWYQSLPAGKTRIGSQYLMATLLGRRAPSQGIAMVRAMAQASERREFASVLLQEWAALDPKSALHAANEFFKLPKDSEEIGRLIGSWARRDAAAASAHLRSLGDGPAQHRLARVVLVHLAESSGALAADLLPRFPGAMRHRETLAAIVSHWSRQDSQAALRWAEGLADADSRQAALGAALEWAANEDPKAALDLYQRHKDEPSILHAAARSFASDPQAGLRWIDTLPTRGERDTALNGLLQEWARLDPKAAAQHVATLPPGELRSNALNLVASQLAQSQPDGILDWVKSLASPQERLAVSTQLAWQLARQDPEQGIALIEALPKGPARTRVMATFASNWAESDLDGALAWMKSQKDPKARQQVLSNLIDPWAASNPAAAAAYIATLPASEVDANAWGNLGANWAQKNPKDAIAWAQSLPAGEAANQAIQSAIGTWAGRSPTEALAFAQSLDNPELRQQSLEAAFQSWSATEPTAAAEALAKIPDPQARASAATQVVGPWAEKDPVAAAAWLAQQDASLRTDNVVLSLSSQLVQFEPQTALQWAATVQDEGARNNAIEQAAREWFEQVPDEASKWLESSGLNPEAIARIKGDGHRPHQGRRPRR